MGKVGVAELYTASGNWVEVDVYDPADLAFTPIELATDTGWGAPFVTSPSSADTPLEVYTQSNGWQGINSVGYVMMDSFEDGNLDEWVESQSTGIDVTSGRAAFQGDYGLSLSADTCERIVSAPTFTPSLPEYPSPGEQWDTFVRFDTSDSLNNDLWHKFGCQTHPTSDGFTASDTYDGYRAELDPPNSALRIGRMDSAATGDGTMDASSSVSVSFTTDQWYRIEIDWHYSTASDIIVRLFESSKADWTGTQVASVSFTDTTYGEGAISCAAEAGVHWDLLRRTAPL